MDTEEQKRVTEMARRYETSIENQRMMLDVMQSKLMRAEEVAERALVIPEDERDYVTQLQDALHEIIKIKKEARPL